MSDAKTFDSNYAHSETPGKLDAADVFGNWTALRHVTEYTFDIFNESIQLNNTSGNKTSGGGDDKMNLAIELYRYVFPVILLFGTTGNCLSVVVLRRRAMRHGCSSVYLTTLAIVDTIVLYVSGLKTWVRILTDFELLHVSDFVCRMVKFSFFSSTHLAAWIVVAVTVERFLIVVVPLTATQYLPVRRPRLVVLAITLVIVGFNINTASMTSLTYDEKNKPQCTSYDSANTFICVVFPKLNLLIYAILPSLAVTILNTSIVVSVARSKQQANASCGDGSLTSQAPPPSSLLQYSIAGQTEQIGGAECVGHKQSAPALRQHGGSNDSSTSTTLTSASISTYRQPTTGGGGTSTNATGSRLFRHVSNQQQRLTVTLMIISMLWVVLSVPYALIDNGGKATGPQGSLMLRIVCYLMMYSNHAVNFYVYCLLGRKFRTELKRAFGFGKYAHKRVVRQHYNHHHNHPHHYRFHHQFVTGRNLRCPAPALPASAEETE